MTPTPTADDLSRAHAWWAGLKGELPADVQGLWFGIVQLDRNGAAGRALYVAGCPEFDAGDPDADWATTYSWWPDGRYADLPGLAALPDEPHERVLDYATALVRELDIRATARVEGAAVGFDDGDFRLL